MDNERTLDLRRAKQYMDSAYRSGRIFRWQEAADEYRKAEVLWDKVGKPDSAKIARTRARDAQYLADAVKARKNAPPEIKS